VLALRDGLRVGVDVVVDAPPGVVDFRVTPPTEEHGYLVVGPAGSTRGVVGVREVVFLEQRALVLVGDAALAESTADTLAVAVAPPEVRAVSPLPRSCRAVLRRVAGDRTPELLGATLLREGGVAVTVLDGEPTATVVGQEVTAVDDRVRVVDADGRPGVRSLHVRMLVAAALHTAGSTDVEIFDPQGTELAHGRIADSFVRGRRFKYGADTATHVTFVIGTEDDSRPSGLLGTYRALDGSHGADLRLDFDGPHAVLVVGKRGYGKSYTLGVIAEELARTPGVAPVIVDPMGVFDTLGTTADGDPVPATVVTDPTVAPDALDPRSWCSLVGLSPESGAGTLLWRAAQESETLAGMRDHVDAADAARSARRAAGNHLALAGSWGVFDRDGVDATALGDGAVTVLDVSGLDAAPAGAVCRGVAEVLYRTRVNGTLDRLPWLLLDEAHVFFEGVAGGALRRLLTRGRAPGVSLVATTQRPGVLPEVALSQSDVLAAHRLTAGDDLDALRSIRPTYLDGTVEARLPTDPGGVLVVDDATETAHAARIRERDTPHAGETPSVTELRAGTGRSD